MKKTISYLGVKPSIHSDVFVAESADIIGHVTIHKDASIWYQCVLRGDINSIEVGKGSNIQDQSILHVSAKFATKIGEFVTVGHGAIIHGCIIEDNVLIGMGACVLDGAIIPKNSIIGAKSLVTKGKTFDEGMLIMGAPAKAIRPLTAQEIESITNSALNYIQVGKEYMEEDL